MILVGRLPFGPGQFSYKDWSVSDERCQSGSRLSQFAQLTPSPVDLTALAG